MKTRKFAGFLLLAVVILVALSGLALADNQGAGPAEKININTAPMEELMRLSGVGQSYARRIIEYRETQGLFSHIEELKNVKGIGDKIFEKNKNRITVELETSKATEQ
jgi:competence protein ComEA